MKVKLLKKLRRKIRHNMFIVENKSKFTINWMYLSIRFKGRLYKTERRFGKCNGKVFKVLHKELEHIVLKDYVIRNKENLYYRLWKKRKI